jgi:hypothetical protein
MVRSLYPVLSRSEKDLGYPVAIAARRSRCTCSMLRHLASLAA